MHAQALRLERRDLIAEFFQTLLALRVEIRVKAVLPTFQDIGNIVLRDRLAFVVERNILAEDLQRRIAKIGGKLLAQIVLFDIFEGKPLSENKKSLAFSLQLNSSEKTLTEEEGDSVVNDIVADVHKTFGAELRSS